MWLRGTKFSSWRYYFSAEERSRQWLDKALNLLSSKAALNMKWFQKRKKKVKVASFTDILVLGFHQKYWPIVDILGLE